MYLGIEDKIVDPSDLLAFACVPVSCQRPCGSAVPSHALLLFYALLQDVPVEALTTVKPYSNEIHAQAQLWLKRDPKASYEAWKKCLPIRGLFVSSRLGRSVLPTPVLTAPESALGPHCLFLTPLAPLCLPGIDGNGKSPSKSELHHLYLTEKYVWRWKQFLSRRGKRTPPLDLKLGHNNWLRQVSDHLPWAPARLPQLQRAAPSHTCCTSSPFSLPSCFLSRGRKSRLRFLVAATSVVDWPEQDFGTLSLSLSCPCGPLFSFRCAHLLLSSPSSF